MRAWYYVIRLMIQVMDSARFQQIYANLPLNARNEIIVVIDDKPLTWNAAKIEVDNDTPAGQEIIKKLIAMGILQ